MRSNGLLKAYGAAVYGADNNWRIPDLVVAKEENWTDRGIEGQAELVIEVRSHGDDSFAKVPFYSEVGVRQVLIIDPETVTVVANYVGEPLVASTLAAVPLTERVEIACLGVAMATVGLDVRSS